MADMQSVHDKIQLALDEANAALGQPSTAAQISTLQAQVTQLTADKAALQSTIDKVRAALG